MKSAIKSFMAATGLQKPYMAFRHALTRLPFAKSLVSSGFWRWEPLVPADAYLDSCRLAIRTLKDSGHTFGHHLEFGVSRGTSLACMRRVLAEEGLADVRTAGFDSFEGMPKESKDEGWAPGEFHSSLPATRRYLKSQKVDLSKVDFVQGWFSNTCNPQTAARLGLSKASLVMVDCDIYTASVQALAFVLPLIADRCVMIFDDWGWSVQRGERGQKEAFEELVMAPGDFEAQELPAYRPEARMFHIVRKPQA